MKHLFLIFITMLAFSCESQQFEKAKKNTHLVVLYKVQISPEDFSLSTFGNPLDLRINILENGKILDGALIKGYRGERKLDHPINMTIKYNPSKNYQIIVEEQSLIAPGVRWSIPGLPKIGLWPIGINSGTINFGKNSKLYFKDKILPVKTNEKIERLLTDLRSTCVTIEKATLLYKKKENRTPSLKKLVSENYIDIPKSVKNHWNIVLYKDKINGYSLFVNNNGNRKKYTYNRNTKFFGPIRKKR